MGINLICRKIYYLKGLYMYVVFSILQFARIRSEKSKIESLMVDCFKTQSLTLLRLAAQFTSSKNRSNKRLSYLNQIMYFMVQ